MLRRDFFKSMIFAGLATVYRELPLPVEIPSEYHWHYSSREYNPIIGYVISTELREDDMYGVLVELTPTGVKPCP